MTKYIHVVALIEITQPSLQGVTSCSTFTSTGCVFFDAKLLLDLQVSSSCQQLSSQSQVHQPQ